MSRVREYLLLSFVLALLVEGCAQEAAIPPPVSSPTATMTAAHIPTPVPSPTPACETIPEGGMTVVLASSGDSVVTGEVDSTTGLAYFLDSAGWLYVFDGASLEIVAKERVLKPREEGGTYALGLDTGSGRIYIADGLREETLILDRETLSPLGSIDAYGRIEVDPVNHRVYIARVGVYVADGETGDIIDQIEETIPEEGMEIFSGVPRGVDVYINPSNRHLYVMMDNNTPGTNWMWWLALYDADDHTLLAEKISPSTDRNGVPAFDLERGLDYLTGYPSIQGDRQLEALDGEMREVGCLRGVSGNVFFSPRHDLIYVSPGGQWGEPGLDVIDAETMCYLDTYPLAASLHDPLNSRFYQMRWGQPTVTVLDEPTVSLAPGGATRSLRGPLPYAPQSLVLSPGFSSDETVFAASGTSLLASLDGGESWAKITLPFLNRGWVHVVVSPTYAQDKTLFVGLGSDSAGSGILRSVDGGDRWTRVNSGLTDLAIQALSFSPDYAHDKTVFATSFVDGAFKSTDGGETWRSLTADFLPEEYEYDRVRQLAVSPAYPRDGHLWFLTSASFYDLSTHQRTHTTHLYVSKDGGETWQPADQGLEGLSIHSLILSPDYGVDKAALVIADGGIYTTRNEGLDWQAIRLPIPELRTKDAALSPGFATDSTLFVAGYDEDYGDRLYRSTDGGQTWLAVGEEFLSDSFWSQSFTPLTLSPLFPTDGLVFASMEEGLYRSTNGGETWVRLSIPGARFLVFSPDFSSDQTILASFGQDLYRSQDGGESWRALHEQAMALSTPLATGAPSPAPISSPTPAGCPSLDPTFQSIADRVESLRSDSADLPEVGCPTQAAQTSSGAWQMFLREAPGSAFSGSEGYMLWRGDTRTIYVIPPGDPVSGLTEVMVYEDNWSEEMPEIPPSCAGLTPPMGLEMPVRGFGKVWCDNSLYDLIGFGLGSEKAVDLFVQEAERGLYISLPEVGAFVIDTINGRALSM